MSQSFWWWVETGNYFQKASFYCLLNGNIARQVARGMLHCAMSKKCVAALRQSFRKVKPDSTSCNASCNKNIACLYHCEACYILCRNKIARRVPRQVAWCNSAFNICSKHSELSNYVVIDFPCVQDLVFFVRSIPSCQITSLLISHVYKTLCFSFEAFRAVKFLQQIASTSKGLLFLKNTLWKKSFTVVKPGFYLLNATVCVKFE